MTADNLARFERLSRAAHQREAGRAAQERLAAQRQWDRRCVELPATITDWYNSGTLGEATQLLTGPSWACACSGPIWWLAPPGTPCGCQAQVDRAQRLRQAAGIVANLMLQAEEARRSALLNEMVTEAEAFGLYDMDVSMCTCGRWPPCRHIDDPEHPPLTRPQGDPT